MKLDQTVQSMPLTSYILLQHLTSHARQHLQQFTFSHTKTLRFTHFIRFSKTCRGLVTSFDYFSFCMNLWAISRTSTDWNFCQSAVSTYRFHCRCQPVSGTLDPNCSDNPSPNRRRLIPMPESSVTLPYCPLPRTHTPERSQRAADLGHCLRRSNVCLYNRQHLDCFRCVQLKRWRQ